MSSYANFFKYIEDTIEEKLNLSCMTELVHATTATTCSISSTNTNGATTTTDGTRYVAQNNKAYDALNAWSSKFYPVKPVTDIEQIPIIKSNTISSDAVTSYGNMFYAVFYACMCLFIELDVEDVNYRHEDVNYSIINGYADSSKSLEDYNPTTQDFFKRAEYWNVRGHLYELLADVESGFYKKYNDKFNDLVSYIDAKQSEFERTHNNKRVTGSTSCSETTSSKDRTTSYAETFWSTGSNLSTLEAKIKNAFEDLEKDVNKLHEQLIGIVFEYISIYDKISAWLSKGDTFVAALQKTSTSETTCLADTFAKVNSAGSFSRYSKDSMDFIYPLFVQAKAERDASKYKDIDDYNIYLRKYLTYKVLQSFNFFPTAVSLERRIKALRSELNF